MTTRHASLPDGFSDRRLMLVTTVFARTWSDSEVSLGSRGVRATGTPAEQARSKPARHQGEDNVTLYPTCMTVSRCRAPLGSSSGSWQRLLFSSLQVLNRRLAPPLKSQRPSSAPTPSGSPAIATSP